MTSALAASARQHDSKQECHKQALQRRLPGHRAQPGDRLSRLFGIRDCLPQPVNRNLECGADFLEGARDVGRTVYRALGNAGRWYLRWFGAHAHAPSVQGNGAATFGYPRVRSFFEQRVANDLWLSATGAVLERRVAASIEKMPDDEICSAKRAQESQLKNRSSRISVTVQQDPHLKVRHV